MDACDCIPIDHTHDGGEDPIVFVDWKAVAHDLARQCDRLEASKGQWADMYDHAERSADAWMVMALRNGGQARAMRRLAYHTILRLSDLHQKLDHISLLAAVRARHESIRKAVRDAMES